MSLLNNFINKRFDTLHSFLVSLSSEFGNFVKLMGANCGILVYENKEKSFEQIADFGYDENFLYSFLLDKDAFSKIKMNRSILVYENVLLYKQNSKLCVILGIFFKEHMKGFLLLEFSSAIDVFRKIFLNLFVQKIENVLTKYDVDINFKFYKQKKSIISILLQSYSFLNKKITQITKNKFCFISGERGVGKKSLVKYICDNFYNGKNFITVKFLPMSLNKFKSILEHWKDITSNGVIVFDTNSDLPIQIQDFLYEYCLDSNSFSAIFILDDINHQKKLSNHFKSLFSQSHIVIPSLNSFDNDLFYEVVHIILENLKLKYQIFNCQFSENALIQLRKHQYRFNFTELIFILENILLQIDSSTIELQDVTDFLKYSKNFVDYEKDDLNLRKSVQFMERRKILMSKKLFNGNQIKMAESLGISRGSLQYKMKQYKIL